MDLDPTVYLPFTREVLKSHFAKIKKSGSCVRNEKHINYYVNSIERLKKYMDMNKDRRGKPITEMRRECQAEKDERFWTASCLMNLFHSDDRERQLVELLKIAYGPKPPIKGFETWEECVEGELHLFFEVKLPSPKCYKSYLKQEYESIINKTLYEQIKSNGSIPQIIPYILDSALKTSEKEKEKERKKKKKKEVKENLEGPTTLDAIIINRCKGFSVLVEAKVLSDISCDTTYDIRRNQIARILDVMLEKNEDLCDPLNLRNPESSLFLLITPRVFKDFPESRLYGYKFNEYKKNPQAIKKDLPHRFNNEESSSTKVHNLENLAQRLGWVTWEDFKEINPKCCEWLDYKL